MHVLRCMHYSSTALYTYYTHTSRSSAVQLLTDEGMLRGKEEPPAVLMWKVTRREGEGTVEEGASPSAQANFAGGMLSPSAEER